MDIDAFMHTNTLVKVRDGSSSLLFDNWLRHGAVVNVFELEGLDGLRGISINEAYSHGQWDVSFLSKFFDLLVISFSATISILLLYYKGCGYLAAFHNGCILFGFGFSSVEVKGAAQPHIFQNLWSSALPLRISLFGWWLFNGLLPFSDVLQDFSFLLPSKCFLPSCLEKDSIQHCFIQSSFTQDVW